MKKLLQSSILLFLISWSSSISAQSWTTVGTSPSCGETVIDASENIFVLSSNSVYKFNGVSWSNLGDPFVGASGKTKFYYNLYTSDAGVPYLTYHYNLSTPPTYDYKSYISYYNGSSWALLGGDAINGGAESHYPAFDAENKILAYNGIAASTINIKKYTTVWESIGTITNSSFSPVTTLEHDNLGNTYIFYVGGGINVKKTEGTTITSVGTTITTSGFCTNCHDWKLPACISPSNVPYVAYVEYAAPNYTLIVNRYINSQWEKITGPTSTSLMEPTSISVNSNDVIFVGYSAGSSSKIMYYDNVTWNEVGIQSFTSVTSTEIHNDMLYKDGCQKYDVSSIELITNSTKENELQKKFTFDTDEFGIQINTSSTNIVSINAYDAAGKIIKSYSGKIQNELLIPVEKQGIYYITIEDGESLVNQKILFTK